MKIKLYESKWENKIKGELAKNFYDKIKEGDIEGVKVSSKDILNKCKDFFDLEDEDNEYILNDIDVLVDEFDNAQEDEEIDELLAELYDFCDDYLILIDVREEPEDAEVFVDSSKDTGTHEEDKIEPVEVIELDPTTDKEVKEEK